MKRCRAKDPVYENRCDKVQGHEIGPFDSHVAGSIVWAPGKTPVNLDILADQWTARHTSIGVMMAADLPPATSGDLAPADELAEWWRHQAEAEIGPTVGKAVEYGSTDLIDIGMMLGRTMDWPVDEAEAAELGVFFYLLGKIARWQSAIQRRQLPSDDTLFDIGVYVRMAQRIRHSGGWPGIEEHTIKQQTYGMEQQ